MRPRRRVLMTVDAVGGVWTYAVQLIRSFHRQDVEFLLCCLGPAPSPSQMGQLHSLNNVKFVHAGFKLEWMDDPWVEVLQAGEWLLSQAAWFKPDVVHLNGYAHASLPWQCPIAIVAHSCVLSWWRAVKKQSAPHRYLTYAKLVRRGLAAADVVVAPTDAMLQALIHEHGPICHGRVIENAREIEPPVSGKKDAFILGAGRVWDEAKNFKLLEEISDSVVWPIHIAGGADRSSPSEPFERLTWRGELNPSQMAQALASASVFVSAAIYEPFGLAVLEAALSRCALVLSDIPTFRELWDGCALFASPENPHEWTRLLNQVCRNEELRLKWSEHAHRRALQFCPQTQGRKYLHLYEELITSNMDQQCAA